MTSPVLYLKISSSIMSYKALPSAPIPAISKGAKSATTSIPNTIAIMSCTSLTVQPAEDFSSHCAAGLLYPVR